MKRRPGIRTVLTLATVGVAVLALALAAVLTGPLVRSSAEREARASLARDADLVARLPLAERLSEATSAGALRTAVSRRGIAVGVVTPTGEARGVAVALTEAELQQALAGERVSAEGSLAGERVLLEARPLETGGAVVLGASAQTVDDSVAAQRRRLLLALGLGLLAAVAAGAVVARRLGAPLLRLAATARRLTAGERAVAAPAGSDPGPREVAEVADALHRLDDALATSEQRQRQFLLSVSHELRTPLTSIRGYAESLVDGVHGPEELPEVGATLVREAERLERYVADLLGLARMEADDFTLAIANVDVARMFAEGAAAWAARCADSEVTLDIDAPPGLVVRTDPGRVRQILDVLTDNALRACPPGSRVVWSAAAARPGGVRVEVRDSGPGLADDDALDAFEPGVLHDRYAADRLGGHGLGLAIAHRLVTRLGGTIRLERAPEGGAAFVLDLPSRD